MTIHEFIYLQVERVVNDKRYFIESMVSTTALAKLPDPGWWFKEELERMQSEINEAIRKENDQLHSS